MLRSVTMTFSTRLPIAPSGGAHDSLASRGPANSSGGSNEFAGKSAWGFLQSAVAGLASVGASAAAFVWRLITRIHTLEIAVRQHQHDLDVSQSANKSALLRLAERLALLHDDHYRLRETIGGASQSRRYS